MTTLPTKTLGILGGGQLGRMSALAAARLGIKTHIYCPEDSAPASEIAARTFTGAYDDETQIKAFADSVDVISYEFENIPVETVRFLKQHKPVYPDDKLLEIAQDRGREKQFLNDLNIPTARWALARTAKEAHDAVQNMPGDTFIFKTTRFGYDGKGQTRHTKGDDVNKTWNILNSNSVIIEELIDLHCEISVIVARGLDGKLIHYAPSLNDHKNHILSRSIVPAPLDERVIKDAIDAAYRLADAVGLIGVMALELFITTDGKILANEIAPRTHNSGHWTIDACTVSQFENHVRAVCGLPLGDPARHSDATMHNLIGDDALNTDKWLKTPGAALHLYGKDTAKPGRKMGHVTILSAKTGQ